MKKATITEPESLRSRKRSKSTTTRSRNSSKESRRSQAKSKSSSGLDCYDPPEYINIEAIRQPTNREAGHSLDNSDWSVNSRPTNRDVGHSLDNSDWSSNSRPANMDVGHSLDNSDWSSNSRPTNKETGRSLDNSDWSLGNSRPEQNGPQRSENRPQEEWSRKPKISNAIGPDDWYRDDFSFDKSHPFMDDPVLLKQYAQILELKYRESSTDRLEQILQKPELLPPADFKLNMHEGRGDVTGMNNEEPVLRYPDSGYDTLKMNLRTERQNMCVDIEAEDSVVLRREGCQRDERKTQTWHSRNFADFQLLEKEGSTVFLSIEGQDTLQSPMKRSPREDKMNWSPNKSFQEIRREKEAPPKNVVKERLRSFESGREEDEPEQCPEVKKREPRMGRVRSKSVNYSAQDSEDEQFEEKKLEKKKSVKDLLSDFEKKSKELQDKEENYRGIGSYLLQDLKESDRRRVFSDTETLMYGTSSDEDNSDDLRKCTAESRVQPSPRDESVDKKRREEQKIVSAPPPLPPKKQSPVTEQDTSSTPTSSKEPFRIRSNSTLDQLDMVVELSGDVEDTYLAMTPSKSLTSLTGTPGRKTSLSMLSSRTSLSSHGSSQSITSQGLPRFGSDKNLGSMTPTEALIQSATGSVNHSRTPSQTLVMEHFQHASHFEEETYVDMNEDGSFVKTPRFREQRSQPILAKQSKKESLDTTLTGDSPESPRYCEISEPNDNAHYEYLYKARTPSAPQHYEVLYQEIEEQNNEIHGTGTIKENKRKVNKKPEPEPLRPIEGLPDILGNAPTNKGNTSSDADDESSKDFDIELKQQTMITLDDSFRPASFYLSHSSQPPNHDNGDESSDSDLVSPPPVPSSPPPMEEVLGYHASTNLEVSDLSGILSAAKSTFGRSRRDSQEDKNRRPSVSSKTSQGSHGSLNNGSQQSLNRDLTMSPHRLHGSHQSLSSRELPPIPGQSLLGSQQSLASKEIQSIGSRHPVENQEALRYSPYHSREGSLDNEMFLYHRFTQGSSLGDPYRKQSSDEFSSDTALYEQEYRKYHLENILEVSNTLERNDSHNTSVISQDLNISYNSVYDTRLQQSKVYKLEDHPALKKRKSLDERQNQPTKDQTDNDTGEDKEELSPRSKVPYYVSDILEEGGSKKSPRENMVDAITKSMNALDVESNSYFESKNEAEDERMRALRRSYTPDPYNSKGSETDQEVQSNVSRSKSLEGLLGDSPGSARDNLGYSSPAPKVYSPHNFNDISSQPRPARGHQPPPPPEGVPPLDIRPLASPAFHNNQEDDDAWADTLRRASLKHQAVKSPELKSKVDQEEVRRPVSRNENTAQPRYRDDRGRQSVPTILNDAGQQTLPYRHDGRQSVPPHAEYRDAERSQRQPAVREERAKLPPPTAPKPKTPVHFERENSYNFNSAAVAEPIKRNTTVHNYHLNFVSTPERYNHQPAQPPHFLEVGLPTPTSSTTSEGPGRQARSATLPARIRYSDSSPRSAEPESPRTSKSGLQDPAAPVPPSPRGIDASVVPSSPRGVDTPVNLTPRSVNAAAHPYVRDHHGSAKENNMPGVGFNPGYTNQFGEPISREGSLGRQSQTEVQGPDPRQRRRSLSSNNKSQDLDNLKKRLGGSLSNMTAGDLLDKTQEELVLILIQLRRQATTLQETVDACKAELDNMRNTGEQGGTELRQHTWELEEQLARLNPVINLVDNMVKLGTLYRGNSNNNNSSSHSQTVRMKTQELAEEQIQRARKTNGNGNGGHLGNGVHHVDFDDLKRELTHVQTQLQAAQKKLESSSGSLVEVERDIFRLSQQLRVSGPSPRESVELSAHLRTLQQAARDLETRRAHTINIINTLRGREAVLVSELDPSGASSSHQGGRRVSAPNLNNRMTEWETPRETWLETDIDNNRTRDWGTEVANNINNKANFGGETATYMNQNFHAGPEVDPSYLNYRVEVALNPYEDDVATVHSEGVRSDYAPPLPDRGGGHSSDRGGEHSSDQEVILGLGELSEADERVQRYYGIIPRERNIEIKTVRMVKRDNKERGKIGRRGDDDSESVELSEMEEEEQTHREEEPPAPLPRGNYSNLHTFLSNQPYENNGSRVNMDEDFNKSLPRPQFKLGEYSTRRGPDSRPGSSMSAHERLFGVSRDESISPDMSPAKVSLASSDSSAPSALMSPVFKSAAARAIIEEERKTPMIIPKAKKKNRARRHMTVTGSQPAAVLEAISRHEKMEAVRSRDDIDLERGLRHAPDVVRSTYGQEDIRENSIDNLFGVPQKINIPLRYRPEQDIEDLSIEERRTRLKKADSIRRMLANTPAPANNDVAGAQNEREQLLALNQVLARQVMERSRLVAGQLPDS